MKPQISIKSIESLLKKELGDNIKNIEKVSSGKIKTAYFFNDKDNSYVIRFAKDDKEFKLEQYLEGALKETKFPLPKTISTGEFHEIYYSISERIEGDAISSLNEDKLIITLPSIMEALVEFHSLNINSTNGYGWLDENKNGDFNTFTEYLKKFFSNDLDGFWKGWHILFKDSFLDYKLFIRLYRKMMELATFCEGRRHLIHSDFHYHNVIIKNCKLEGVIDFGRVSYLDFVFDIATLVLEFPNYNLLNKFEEFYKNNNLDVSDFKERFLCAALCNSLDGMRFWAKFGDEGSYKAIVNNILNILEIYTGEKINERGENIMDGLVFNVEEAIKFSKEGRIEDWVHLFLNSVGDNVPFSEGLKLVKRSWIGPVLMDICKLNRCCGPEETMEYRIDSEGWEKDISKFQKLIREGWDMPPLIVEQCNGKLKLNDGNHRLEAMVREGVKECWVILWSTP